MIYVLAFVVQSIPIVTIRDYCAFASLHKAVWVGGCNAIAAKVQSLAMLLPYKTRISTFRQRRQFSDANGATDLAVDASIEAKASATEQPELQNDMLLSTLKSYISEMGGRLKLVAQFPDEEIVINEFDFEPALPPMKG